MCFVRNSKGSPSGWNKMTLDSSTKPYEEINILENRNKDIGYRNKILEKVTT